ncbi:hypothetical protein [Methylocella sp.]|uniref:hypothetical protein n=1 Tax=Methylocella sp. TaxID=1978226 RepID=UPI0035B01784
MTDDRPTSDEEADALFADLAPARRAPEAEQPMGGGSDQLPAQAAQDESYRPMSDHEADALFADLAPQKPSGVAANVAAGVNEGLAATLGAPVDAVTWAANKGARALGFDRDIIQHPYGGSENLANLARFFGVRTGADVVSNGPMERAARAAGAGVGATVAPQAMLGALAKAGALTPAAMEAFGSIIGQPATLGQAAADVTIGAASGGGGSLAGDAAQESGYGPGGQAIAGAVGGLAGGLAAGVATSAVGKAAEEAGGYIARRKARRAGETGSAVEGGLIYDAAARKLERAVGGEQAAKGVADDLRYAETLVPGSEPTAFQASGNMELGSLERAAATKDPVSFQQRRADQNAARLDALEAIAPEGSPEAVPAHLRQSRADMDAEATRALDAATGKAAEATRTLGGDLPPEAAGQAMRAEALAAERAARDNERQLWSAVDPNGTLTLPAASTTGAAAKIVGDMPKSAKPMQGEEAAIFDVARSYGEQTPFRELTALRSRVSTAMRDELSTSGQTPSYARLARLRGAIEDDITGAADAPHFDPEAASRLQAASAATKDRAQTFGALRDITRRSGQSGPFSTPDAVVPGKIFQSGPKGFESASAYRRAVGDETATAGLADYAAMSLRRAAERVDGVLDPAKVATWRDKHQDALRALPGLDAKFADAQKAAEAIGDVAVRQRQAADAFSFGAVGKLLGIDDPADVQRVIGGVFTRQDAAKQMRHLAELTAGKVEARQGLRKAVADIIVSKASLTGEAATSGRDQLSADKFSAFLKQNRQAMRHVFNDAELESMTAVASDMRRASRSLNAVRIPNQSNTSQDLLAVSRGRPSILETLLAAKDAPGGMIAATMLGHAFGAPAIAASVVASFRHAGLQRVDDVVKQALLDPQLAKRLLERAAQTRGEQAAHARGLGAALTRSAVLPSITRPSSGSNP